MSSSSSQGASPVLSPWKDPGDDAEPSQAAQTSHHLTVLGRLVRSLLCKVAAQVPEVRTHLSWGPYLAQNGPSALQAGALEALATRLPRGHPVPGTVMVISSPGPWLVPHPPGEQGPLPSGSHVSAQV